MSTWSGSHRSVETDAGGGETMHCSLTVVFVSDLRTPCQGEGVNASGREESYWGS